MAESQREEITKLESLYAGNPGGRVFVHLAEAYRKAGEYDRARDILREGLARHADAASGHVVLGRVLMDLGESDDAAGAFHRVLELDAGNLVALRALADLARDAGRIDEARAQYRELLVRNPTNGEVRAALSDLDRPDDTSPEPADLTPGQDRPWDSDEAPALVESGAGLAGADEPEFEVQEQAAGEASLDEAGLAPPSAAPGDAGETVQPGTDFELVDASELPGDLAAFAQGGAWQRHDADDADDNGAEYDEASAMDLAAAGEPELDLESLQEPVGFPQPPETDDLEPALDAEVPDWSIVDTSDLLEIDTSGAGLQLGDVAEESEDESGAGAEEAYVLPGAPGFFGGEDPPLVGPADELEIVESLIDGASAFRDEPPAQPAEEDARVAAWVEDLARQAPAEAPPADWEQEAPDAEVSAPGEVEAEEPWPEAIPFQTADLEPDDLEATDFEATDFEPTEFEPTDFEATDFEATDFEPTEVEPTEVELTEVELTEVELTEVEPTEVVPARLDVPESEVDAEFAVGDDEGDSPSHKGDIAVPAEATEPVAGVSGFERDADTDSAEAEEPGPAMDWQVREPEPGDVELTDPETADVDGPDYVGTGLDVVETGPEGPEIDSGMETSVAEPGPVEDVQGTETADLEAGAEGADGGEEEPEESSYGSDFVILHEREEHVADVSGLETETMADLYLRQGFTRRAADVYRALLRRRPDDDRLRARLRETEAMPGHSTPEPMESLVEEDESGEVWLREAGTSWAPDAAAPADDPTPYAWVTDEPEPDEADSGPAISEYLSQLVSWRAAAVKTPDAGSPVTPDATDSPDASSSPAREAWQPAERSDEGAGPSPGAASTFREPDTAAGAEGGEATGEPGARTDPVEAAFNEWYGAPAPQAEPVVEEDDDDEDLAMFRSWLQSLKK
jgi:tetratricopeptide (TPR) repeat protein